MVNVVLDVELNWQPVEGDAKSSIVQEVDDFGSMLSVILEGQKGDSLNN